MSVLPKLIYKYNATANQNFNKIFADLNTFILKFMWDFFAYMCQLYCFLVTSLHSHGCAGDLRQQRRGKPAGERNVLISIARSCSGGSK